MPIVNTESAEAHVAGVASAPWWFAGLLMLLGAWMAHLLTKQRDGRKVEREWLDRWEKAIADQAKKIADDAIKHYIAADAIQNTPVSSALLLNELKRLQSMLGMATCTNSSDAARSRKAFRYFHDCITLELDFQDPDRAVRRPNDALVDRIQAAESELLTEARKSRSRNVR